MRVLFALLLSASLVLQAADEVPLVDAHIHYSHDAWDVVPPERAIAILRAAGVQKALVSSSGDEGTRRLYRLDPDLIVPVLRPYRKRGELGRWLHDDTVPPMLRERLDSHYYAGIGEFHADGEQIELPVVQQVIEMAKARDLFLQVHSDADAVHRIFRADPDARVLWAHAGFETSDVVGAMMETYPKLWADLSFREEIAYRGRLDSEWRDLFIRFPTRFMVGTDTYTPERWFDVGNHADWARAWLDSLPADIAAAIAYRNAHELLQQRRTP